MRESVREEKRRERVRKCIEGRVIATSSVFMRERER